MQQRSTVLSLPGQRRPPLGTITLPIEPHEPQPTSCSAAPLQLPREHNCYPGMAAASAAAQANIHKAPTWCRRRPPGRTPEEQRLPCSSRATASSFGRKIRCRNRPWEELGQETFPRPGAPGEGGWWKRGRASSGKHTQKELEAKGFMRKITGRRGTGCRSDICARRGAGGLDGIGLESQRGLRWSQQADRSATGRRPGETPGPAPCQWAAVLNPRTSGAQGPSEALEEQVVLGRALRSLRSSHLHFLLQVLPGQDAPGAATAGPRGRKRKIFFSRRAKEEGERVA